MTADTLEDVWRDIEAVGEATSRQQQAMALVADLRRRVERVKQYSYSHRPRVLSLEWMSPPFNGGPLVPEMVELAGGVEPLGHISAQSLAVRWGKIICSHPHSVLVI